MIKDQLCSTLGHEFLKNQEYYPVIDIGEKWNVLDLSEGYVPETITLDPPSIGRYNEKRHNMYTSDFYEGKRNVHMGIDVWMPAGTPVYSFSDGIVLFYRDNITNGDYGPTIVTEHKIGNSRIYALFGHLSRSSLRNVYRGMSLARGEKFTELGDVNENGGWLPHLHFQLSLICPEGPDMPGVVSDESLSEALKIYPDPQLVLGRLY